MIKCISPIDGRYHNKVKELENYFSEYALMKYRVLVEVEYFIKLLETVSHETHSFKDEEKKNLRKLYLEFSDQNAERIKSFELTTNHDVKAVEYFIKEQLEGSALSTTSEFVHFALTSQDINNTAVPLMIKDALSDQYLPLLSNVIEQLNQKSKALRKIPMLARTHGQPASPTGLGKEIAVFVERLINQKRILDSTEIRAKFGGATGNFNAHHIAYPAVNWIQFSNDFINNLGLLRSQQTTQIDHYDSLAEVFHAMARINTILIDFCRDVWTYISMNYFNQKVIANEVGSSAMPHKVNPIDFENAEGNLGIANALFYYLAEKLPVSRLQRDLTDSTVSRNIGVPFAHTIIAIKSLLKGLDKLEVNKRVIEADLKTNWSVVAEGIQNILRREKYPKPYEALKAFSRGKEALSKEDFENFIESLTVSGDIKNELRRITPFNYVGYALD